MVDIELNDTYQLKVHDYKFDGVFKFLVMEKQLCSILEKMIRINLKYIAILITIVM